MPETVIEPTVGRGAFLEAAARAFPTAKLFGWDVNAEHVKQAAARLADRGWAARSEVREQDFFTHDWTSTLDRFTGEILLLGNPPWVTNSGVSVVNGTNLPVKKNSLGLSGIAARTGKANFDISEWMLLRLLEAIGHRAAMVAMLCKTATARKVLRHAWQHDGRISKARLYRIDAAKHFGAAVDACLLVLSTGAAGLAEADVFTDLKAAQPSSRLGLRGKELVADLSGYRALHHLEGTCPFQWRSGVKHDCAAVMELHPASGGRWINGLGEFLELEPHQVFPLLKCSDLANGRLKPRRAVIVSQRHTGDDTSSIAHHAPNTWRYLQSHAERFRARKSSIYQAAAPFALFGIGRYAFSPWKVAVSALHRSARFHAVGPIDEQPVFFDDACYYLSFEDGRDAHLVSEILNSALCQKFLSTLVFPDAKRPLTVDLLQRLHLAEIAAECGLASRWQDLRQRTEFDQPGKEQLLFTMEAPSGMLPAVSAHPVEPAP